MLAKQIEENPYASLRSAVGVTDLVIELALEDDGEMQIAELTEMLWRGAQYGLTSNEIQRCLNNLIAKSQKNNSTVQVDLTAADCQMPSEEELAAWL